MELFSFCLKEQLRQRGNQTLLIAHLDHQLYRNQAGLLAHSLNATISFPELLTPVATIATNCIQLRGQLLFIAIFTAIHAFPINPYGT